MRPPCPMGHNEWVQHGDGRSRRWRCRPCWAAYHARRRKVRPHESLLYSARRRARQQGVPFTLTLDDVRMMLTNGWTCAYCQHPLGTYTRHAQPDSATLDRIDPEHGYTAANTVLCCHQCNSAKASHTLASLTLWIDRLHRVINGRTPRVEAP